MNDKSIILRRNASFGAVLFIVGLCLMYLGKGWLNSNWLFLIVPIMFIGGLMVANYYGYLLKQNGKYKR